MSPFRAICIVSPVAAGVAACAFVEDAQPIASASDRRIQTLQGTDVGSERNFDYRITLEGVFDNNNPLAGRSLALREARKLCGLKRTPSAANVDLTLGLAAYTRREYFIRCQQPGKDAK